MQLQKAKESHACLPNLVRSFDTEILRFRDEIQQLARS